MQVLIESTHTNADHQLKQHITEKFDHLNKIFDRIVECRITLRHQEDDHKQNCILEARLLVPGDVLFAEEHAETFETALPKVLDSLKHQLHRYKEKLQAQ